MAEDQVAALSRGPAAISPAPPAGVTPAKYATLVPGTERERQWRLGWWDRFQIADGFWASVARFAVSGALVASMIAVGLSVGGSNLAVYNGLARKVVVHVDDQQWTLLPFEETTFNDLKRRRVHIVAETTDGEVIESFDQPLGRFDQFVYSVAGGAPIVSWIAASGGATPAPPRELGTPRWSKTDASILFQAPARRFAASGGGGTISVLSGLGDDAAEYALSRVPDPAERRALIRTRATWDEGDHPHTDEWLRLASDLSDFDAILRARLARAPHDVVSLRTEQDRPDPAAKAAACARQQGLADAEPNDGDLKYLALRCQPRGPVAGRRTHRGVRRHAWKSVARHGGGLCVRRALRVAPDARRVGDSPREFGGMPFHLSIENARVMRLVGPEMDEPLDKLAQGDPMLRNVLALETDKDLPDGRARAYQRLVHGDLPAALLAAEKDAGARPRVLRFVAASRGATPGQIAEALALPADAGIDFDTIWPALGLAVREKRDATALVAHLEEMAPADDRATVLAFLHPLLHGHGAPQLTAGLDPGVRGRAYVLACVILGDAAPGRLAIRRARSPFRE